VRGDGMHELAFCTEKRKIRVRQIKMLIRNQAMAVSNQNYNMALDLWIPACIRGYHIFR
jgi:hypothetical protein